jgi:hypothetical protein
MKLQEVIDALNLKVYTTPQNFSELEPSCGYASDLLSCVMAGASKHSIWVTLQAHGNIVAVATLLDLTAVIITENALPEQAIIDKANEEGVILLGSSNSSFYVIGKLWELGLRCKPEVETQ